MTSLRLLFSLLFAVLMTSWSHAQTTVSSDAVASITFRPQAATPSQPAAGFKVFSDASGNLKYVDSAGVVHTVSIPSVSGNSGRMLTTDGTSLVWSVQPTGTVPSVTGNAGKMMITDGSSASWGNSISSLTTTSGRVTALSTITGNTTLDTTYHHVVCDSTSAFTVTLPAASGNTGREYRVKNINTGTVTVNVTSNGTIDNATSFTLGQWQAAVFVSNGSIWLIN